MASHGRRTRVRVSPLSRYVPTILLSFFFFYSHDQRLVCYEALDTGMLRPLTRLTTVNFLITSVSHTKATLVGTSISIPITGGSLNLGNWQGSLSSCFSGT